MKSGFTKRTHEWILFTSRYTPNWLGVNDTACNSNQLRFAAGAFIDIQDYSYLEKGRNLSAKTVTGKVKPSNCS